MSTSAADIELEDILEELVLFTLDTEDRFLERVDRLHHFLLLLDVPGSIELDDPAQLIHSGIVFFLREHLRSRSSFLFRIPFGRSLDILDPFLVIAFAAYTIANRTIEIIIHDVLEMVDIFLDSFDPVSHSVAVIVHRLHHTDFSIDRIFM